MSELFDALELLKNSPNKSGIFTDLDGTLSEIAPTPADAVVTEGMRDAISKLAKKFAVVVIVSGRDSDEAKNIIAVEDLIYIGNHGLEWTHNGKQFYAPEAFNFFGLASSLSAELESLVDGSDLIVEKKKLGVAIHYRRASDKELARISILEIIKPFLEKYPLKSFEGRCVIELKPDLMVSKGDAVTAIALRLGIKQAVYLGDDVTDLDAFKALKKLRDEGKIEAITIGIASDETSKSIAEESDFLLRSVGEVEDVLNWLAN
ncbi:MAG: trehalose-phosphatase [Firmicutes bacterium]|nr:trehalose-phosphatase [Bacillota bacterium]